MNTEFLKKAGSLFKSRDPLFLLEARLGLRSRMPDDVYLRRMFRSLMDYDLNLCDPKTFSEKIQWLKLHDRNPLYTELVDKIAVKGYIASAVGDQYNVPLLGVYDDYLVAPLAQVLINLGVRRGMVVYGQDKLDEISMSAPTNVCEIKDGWFRAYTIAPEDFGLKRCTREELRGGTPAENAQIVRAILSGAERGPKRSAVLLNAGASLYIGGRADTMQDGVALAGELIDSGRALETLEKLIAASNLPEEAET